jgi:copper chaperone CopZ
MINRMNLYQEMEDIMKRLFLLVMTGVIFVWAFGTVTAEETKDGSVKRAVFKVENLTCGACFTNINSALSPLEGFAGMGSNLFRKLIAVDFAGPLTTEEIGAAITKKGYPATLTSVDPVMEKESFAYLNSNRGPVSGGGCCSGGTPPVAERSQVPQSQVPQSGITGGGSCCILGGSQLPPATIN